MQVHDILFKREFFRTKDDMSAVFDRREVIMSDAREICLCCASVYICLFKFSWDGLALFCLICL